MSDDDKPPRDAPSWLALYWPEMTEEQRARWRVPAKKKVTAK